MCHFVLYGTSHVSDCTAVATNLVYSNENHNKRYKCTIKKTNIYHVVSNNELKMYYLFENNVKTNNEEQPFFGLFAFNAH